MAAVQMKPLQKLPTQQLRCVSIFIVKALVCIKPRRNYYFCSFFLSLIVLLYSDIDYALCPNLVLAYDYEMKNKTWNDTQCKQLADEPMKMPAGGLEECKKTCNGNTECYAFEYSVKGDCCVFREMCDPKEPTVTNATHHGDMYKDYKGYVKGMMVMI